VRGVALWIVGLVIGCAPDYAHTAFRCGTGDAGDPECPDRQSCILGRCRRATPAGDGIKCPTDPGVCATGDRCCFIEGGTSDCGAANLVCKGGVSALCDSRNDCGDDYCCADGTSVFCDAHCGNYACQHDGDCPPEAPHCCRPDRAVPWGTCSDVSC
jgi:hypothetical protein